MHSFERITHVAEQLVLDAQYTPDDRVISYLPLAHVFERAYGAAAAFVASPRVYFAESVETFLEDIRRARPTLFVSVPRLWVKFQQGVHRKLPPAKLGRAAPNPGSEQPCAAENSHGPGSGPCTPGRQRLRAHSAGGSPVVPQSRTESDGKAMG